MKQFVRLSTCVLLVLALVACSAEEKPGKEQNASTGSGQAVEQTQVTGREISDTDGPALKDIYADYFMMGAAINGTDKETAAIHHEGMAAVLKKHYNSTTLSNLMKPCYLLDEKKCIKSGKGKSDITEVALNFDSCEESLKFCHENGIKMRGHTLVWHNQTPEWFFKKNYDKKKGYVSKKVMAKRMENYIKGVLEYCQKNYPGVIYCWDVVNECVDDGTGDTSVDWNCRAMFNGGDNFWHAVMGPDYVEKAFEYARKYADKDVKLIYNDYNVYNPAKCENIFNLAKGLKEKGLIDGLGLQPTVDLYNPDELSGDSVDSFETCLNKYAELGLEIQITELSFKIDEDTGERDEQSLKRQADRYQEMFELLKRMDTAGGGKCNITSVSIFGICDDYPLYDDCVQCLYVWDKECKPKEAFYRIREVGETK